MKLFAREKKFTLNEKDTLSVFLTEDFQKDTGGQIPEELSFIREKANLSYFKGKAGEILFLPINRYPAVILSGIGKKDEITAETLRNSAGSIVEVCRKKKITDLHVVIPHIEKTSPADASVYIAEGISLSNYDFSKYKTRNDDAQKPVEKVTFYTEASAEIIPKLREIEITARNTHLCRNLVNEISDQSNPPAIASEAKKLSKLKGVSCKVYGKKDLEKLKMGLLLAVGRGSTYPPQLVVLKYTGDPRNKKSVAIVGKGITFDSGGLNLKPSGHIEDMRSDMAGAAACLYTIGAAAELKLKVNLHAVIPLCENMLSNNSYRPGDVYIAYNGKSVEIGNTDAEGRLILADALAFAENRIRPDYIIDIATLTGACLVCFGELVAGLLTASDELAESLIAAGEATGERLWRMPLYKEYGDDLKSDIADLTNVASGRNAGTIMGAMFMKNFVKDTPWAHIDIAGTAWYSKQRGYRPKNATGFGVRLLIDTVRRLREKQ